MPDPADAHAAALVRALGLAPSQAQWAGLESFWTLLLAWNARINLTGARTRADLVGEHLPDALVMAALVPAGARVVDVGSGGGLPALPFALLRPESGLTLVEPRTKRAAFLRTAVRELRLARVEVRGERVEELPGGLAEVAGSRATFEPSQWLDRARHLAPRALVFAARRAEVSPAPAELEVEHTYATAAGHPRWVGLFRFT